MKIDNHFNMKILDIHNILLAKSLRGFLPILQNMLMSMECFPTPMDLVGISRCHACMYDNSSSVIFRAAAGMCNGRERSGRQRRNGHSLPQAILTLTDEEWDGEE